MSALDELRASLTPPSAPVERPITVGAIVCWAFDGKWQYGTVQNLDRPGRRAFIRPHCRIRDCWPKPFDELEVILTGDEHRATIEAAHAARIYGS
jgi:hypothetical protein